MAENLYLKIEAFSRTIVARYADGLSFGDLWDTVTDVSAFADGLGEYTAEERREVMVAMINRIIDSTDTPWLPDSLSDPLMKLVVPWLIDVVLSK